jgi:hypothetical protein
MKIKKRSDLFHFLLFHKKNLTKKKGSLQGIVSEVGEPEFWLHVSTDSRERNLKKKYKREKALQEKEALKRQH